MRVLLQAAIALATMLPLGVTLARAESAPGPLFVVTYIEVANASAANGVTALRQYRTAVGKEAGNERCEVAEEIGRPNRFVILEIWKDQAAFEAHGKAAAAKQLQDKLKAILQAPPDERVHNGFAVAANAPIEARNAVFVASHVDVPPPRKDDIIAALRPLAEASRKADGNLRFEVVQQTSRPNHFTVIEVWKDRPTYEGRGTGSPQKSFRATLGPMLGALYDERLYRPIE